MNRLHVVIVAIVALLAAGCQPEAPRSAAPASAPMTSFAPGTFVSIAEIDPDPKTPLHVGDKVKLHIVAGYMLEQEAGSVAVVVQAADNAGITQNMQVISRGNGKAVLDAEFTVPNTKAVQVFVPIHVPGQGGSTIVDSRAYRVEGK